MSAPADVAARLPPVTEYVDAQMVQICEEFDWLKAVTPLHTEALWETFRDGGCSVAPRFTYPDPGIDIDAARRSLIALPIHEIEEPVFMALLAEKQRELDRQLELVELRETEGFLQASIDLFGIAAPALYAEARHILEAVPPDKQSPGDFVGLQHVTEAALRQFAYYRRRCPDFSAQVRPTTDIAAGFMVSNGDLYVSRQVRVPRDRLDALLHHEIGTHVLTCYNGTHQPLQQLRFGLAHYDELQEGLGVLSEYLAGNLSALRLRTLAARVVAVRMLTDDASFIDVFRALHAEHGFSQRAAFVITVRIFRGGGLTKDVVYLRGLRDLLAYLREGHPFERLFAGKFALSQLPALKDMYRMGQLEKPKIIPAYMHNAAAQKRLADCCNLPLDHMYQQLVA